MSPTMPTPENLDAFVNPDTLWAWAERFGHGVRPIKAARALFPDRPKGYLESAKMLRNYAYNKATAMRIRLGTLPGGIRAAVVYENICDLIYERLPNYARFW